MEDSRDSHLLPIWAEPPRECSYLPSEQASLHYVFHQGLAPADLEALISRGWRRFGSHLFRPACSACRKCISLRVNVAEFAPTKSQRRARRRNAHIHVELHPATVTAQHVDLYNRWHADMAVRSDWRLQQTSPASYAESFLLGDCPSLHELRYFDGTKLVGVGLIEILPHSLSSVYFFHDPEWRPLGPGTYSVLCEVELARALNLAHLYLGYWIEQCPSMSYKNRFVPHEILIGRPGIEEEPLWQRVTAQPSSAETEQA